MLDHLELLFGSVRAVAAVKRLSLGVRQVVMSETRRPPEAFAAQSAHVGPTVAVLPLVGLQDENGLEGFATFFADVRAHVAVLSVAVSAEGVCSVGAVVTLSTGEGPLSCVLGHVVLQLRRPLTFVTTLWTKELLLILVNPQVKLQPIGVSAGVCALLTAVRLLSSVDTNVPCHLLLVVG